MGRQGRIGDRIATAFAGFDIQKPRGGYTLVLVERNSGRPLARLKPLPEADRFELIHWSVARDKWKTFGPVTLEPDDTVVVVRRDPRSRIKRKGVLASLLD